jgi:D-inositol-3-phosphate glycosyltransferase
VKNLLWVGDAACASGFAKSTHSILETVRHHYNVSILGLNYFGDPHPYPYDIYRAGAQGELFGVRRIRALVDKTKADVVVIQNDPWNIPAYLEQLDKGTKVVAILAVDGKNCRASQINGLSGAIFWTQFGLDEARLGGYSSPARVIPLGVDLDVFHPIPEARKLTGFPPRLRDVFIVGNVNRNQPRKRHDLLISYFAEWVTREQIEDAYLYVHTCPTGENAFDHEQLMQYYGFDRQRARLILETPEVGQGETEARVAQTYNCFDVMFTPTQGEGFGLTTLEGMACGIPQIFPDWSALGEWAKPGGVCVPCTSIACTINNINVIGGVVDRELSIQALDRMYRDRAWRAEQRDRALALAAQPQYRWNDIGRRVTEAIQEFTA